MGALLRVPLEQLTKMLRLNTGVHLQLVHHFGRLFEMRGGGGIGVINSRPARNTVLGQLRRRKGVPSEHGNGPQLSTGWSSVETLETLKSTEGEDPLTIIFCSNPEIFEASSGCWPNRRKSDRGTNYGPV